MIFSIGLGIEGGSPRRGVLKDFSETTGGRYFYVKKAGQLAEVNLQIARGPLGRSLYQRIIKWIRERAQQARR